MPKSFFGDEEQKELEKGIGDAMDEVDETTPEEGGSEEEVESIKVGEKEYSAEDLEAIVGLGQRAKEIGESHGGFDKYVSEFGKKSQRIGDLKKEIEESKSAVVTKEGGLTDEAKVEAQKAARELGIVLTDDVEKAVAEALDKGFDNRYASRRSGEKLLEEVKTLATDIDGTDGRPKFDGEKVLSFMQENPGFKDPSRAYKAMHLDEIAEWSANQVLSKKKKGITTNTQTKSGKAPKEVAVNRDNLHEQMVEALNV